MDILDYSQHIVDALDAIKTARTADDALRALDRLETLATDYHSLRMLVVAFQILHHEFMAAGTNDSKHMRSDG